MPRSTGFDARLHPLCRVHALYILCGYSVDALCRHIVSTYIIYISDTASTQ